MLQNAVGKDPVCASDIKSRPFEFLLTQNITFKDPFQSQCYGGFVDV